MRLSRRQMVKAAQAAERQQDDWVRLFGGDDDSRAVRVLWALADQYAQHGITAGDVGVIAVEAVRYYDAFGRSASNVRYRILDLYDKGRLRNVLGQPLKKLVERRIVSLIALSALVNARPESKDEVSRLGKLDRRQ